MLTSLPVDSAASVAALHGAARVPALEWMLEAHDGIVARLALDLACVSVLIRGVYYHHYRRAHLFLTFFSFNLVIFLLAFLLREVEMTLGTAFGLFAVFSMLRYRTEGISIQDMTYLFLVIALGLLMAVGGSGWGMLVLLGVSVIGCTLLLEGDWLTRRELSQRVLYENVALLDAGAREDLLADLRRRTGLDVQRVDVQEIDFVRDTASLTVYYHAPRPAARARRRVTLGALGARLLGRAPAVALLAVLVVASGVGAQTSRDDPTDVQAWYGAGLRLDLPDRWRAAVRYQLRMDHDATEYRGSYLTTELERRVHDRISVLGGYRLALRDGESAHRFTLGSEGTVQAAGLRLSLRPMLQYRIRRVEDDDGDELLLLRTRLRAERRLTSAVDVYVATEPYVQFGGDHPVRRWRNTAGVQLRYARGRRVDLFYAYRPDYARSYNRAFHLVGMDLDFAVKLGGGRGRGGAE